MKLETAIQIAGLVQIAIAAANFVLPGMLRYRENLDRVEPVIRQIFRVHAAYIVLVLFGFAAANLFFAEDFVDGSGLGTFLCGFLAVFWILRLLIQLFYYDRGLKRRYLAGHLIFSAAFLYLGVVFAIGAFSRP